MQHFLPTQAELLDWQKRPVPLRPWEPDILPREEWSKIDYRAVYAWRLQQLKLLENPEMLASAKAFYAEHPVEFILHWIDTYDPRKTSDKWVPFIFFERQAEFIRFLHSCRNDKAGGLVEKARDMGATWGSCAYTIWSWLFIPSDAIGWGSRKENLVDLIGNPDSIFEKMRLIVRRLPDCFLPQGFEPKRHATFMKFINPETGAVIMGEAGDNIGRGGRTAMYFKDESAHYERPEKIEAALGDNTNVQIDISSVNGLGNVFHRRREAGVIYTPEWTEADKEAHKGFTRVFIMDWRDHPNKTEAWFEEKRAKYEREGMLHLFAQEVERNYSAAVLNTIIDLDWIKAAIDAHLHIPYLIGKAEEGPWSASLDVADEGMDRNAFGKRKGIVLKYAKEWGDRDPGASTRYVLDDCSDLKGSVKVQYDCIGVGVAVKSEFNRLSADPETAEFCKRISMVPWHAGSSVQHPFGSVIPDDEQSPTNADFFDNLKAQGWWSLRTRFYKTWRARKFGVIYPVEELISLDSTLPLIRQIEKELAQPTRGKSKTLKMVVNKTPEGTKSPNLGDMIMMLYFPVIEEFGVAAQGTYGNV